MKCKAPELPVKPITREYLIHEIEVAKRRRDTGFKLYADRFTLADVLLLLGDPGARLDEKELLTRVAPSIPCVGGQDLSQSKNGE